MTTTDTLRSEILVDVLLRLLTAKFGPLPRSVVDTVTAASSAELEAWVVRTVIADTLDEILGVTRAPGRLKAEDEASTVDMLRAELRAWGYGKDYTERHIENYIEAHVEIFVQVATGKFGPLPQSAVDTVNAASIELLKTWFGRVRTADTLDDVLA